MPMPAHMPHADGLVLGGHMLVLQRYSCHACMMCSSLWLQVTYTYVAASSAVGERLQLGVQLARRWLDSLGVCMRLSAAAA
jgi:hypothetical protein